MGHILLGILTLLTVMAPMSVLAQDNGDGTYTNPPLHAGKRSRVEGDKRIEGAGVRSGSCRVGSFARDGSGVSDRRALMQWGLRGRGLVWLDGGLRWIGPGRAGGSAL
jgi:hypothetical protein